MSKFVVVYLNPYRRPDCKLGRIQSTEDFKHLARRVSEGKIVLHCCSFVLFVFFLLGFSVFGCQIVVD